MKILARDKDRVRSESVWGQNGCMRSSAGSVECFGIEVHRKNRFRTDWIRYDARGGCEVRDQQMLRHIIVVHAVAGPNHGIGMYIPGETNARSEIVEIAVIQAVKSVRADHGERP